MSKDWTLDDIPDQTGRIAIVTGANTGIGYETALALADAGATVVMACRNLEKASAAASQCEQTNLMGEVVVMQLDLGDLDSVRRFSDEFHARYGRLDLLINNAGIMWIEYSKTKDGFESQFGTNHLGHFALTGLLLDLLLATPGSRVVNVSSVGHRNGVMDFDNLMFDGGDGYSRHGAYSRSKLANLLFTYELQRRFEAIQADAMAVAAHPGTSNTELSRHVDDRWYVRLGRPLLWWMIQSAAMGALPTLRAAVDPDVKGGQYYGPGGFMEARGYPKLVESNDKSHDEAVAARLWDVSEELTGVHFEMEAAINER